MFITFLYYSQLAISSELMDHVDLLSCRSRYKRKEYIDASCLVEFGQACPRVPIFN